MTVFGRFLAKSAAGRAPLVKGVPILTSRRANPMATCFPPPSLMTLFAPLGQVCTDVLLLLGFGPEDWTPVDAQGTARLQSLVMLYAFAIVVSPPYPLGLAFAGGRKTAPRLLFLAGALAFLWGA